MRVKSLNDPYQNRLLIRHLELTGDVVRRTTLWPGTVSSNVCTTGLRKLFNLQVLTMSIDHCYEVLPQTLPPRASTRKTGKAIADTDEQQVADRVVDYGNVEVPQRFKSDVQIFIKRFNLINAVKFARSLDRSSSLRDMFRALPDSKDEKFAEHLFALRLACIEAWRNTSEGTPLEQVEQTLVDICFLRVTQDRMQQDLDSLLKKVPSDVRLLDFSPDKQGQKVMELANDIVGSLLPPQSSVRQR